MTERQITHFVGDRCEPNGHHPDKLIARLRGEVAALRAARQDYDAGHQAVADRAAEYFTEAADALERAERVVEAAKQFAEHNDETRGDKCAHGAGYNVLQRELRRSLAAYDTTRADVSATASDTPESADTTRADTVCDDMCVHGDHNEACLRHYGKGADQHVRGLNAEEGGDRG